MRRQDREISDLTQICGILKRSRVCFLSLCDGSTPYTVPMNLRFTEEAGCITLYLHSAKRGRKRTRPKESERLRGIWNDAFVRGWGDGL